MAAADFLISEQKGDPLMYIVPLHLPPMERLFLRENGPQAMVLINSKLVYDEGDLSLEQAFRVKKQHALNPSYSWAPSEFWGLFFSLVAHTTNENLRRKDGRFGRRMQKLSRIFRKPEREIWDMVDHVVRARYDEESKDMVWVDSRLNGVHGHWFWIGEVNHNHEYLCRVCQKETRKRCQDCRYHFYCSPACSTQDWSWHRHFCKAWRKSFKKPEPPATGEMEEEEEFTEEEEELKTN